jgi:hypothetical protein
VLQKPVEQKGAEMSITPYDAMDDGDFKQCFDVIQKTGENTRSIIYVYILIFGALLIWALNAIVYPAEQSRIDQIRQKQVEGIKCLIRLEGQKAHLASDDNARDKFNKQCSKFLQGTSLEFDIGEDGAMVFNKETEKFEVPKMDIEFMKHELQYQSDKAAELARFSVPIIGISSDRNWLWLIGVTLGPLFYYFIRDSFSNLQFLLDYVYERNSEKPHRLALLATTQIISSSTQRMKSEEKTVDRKTVNSTVKLTVMSLMFGIPILLLGLIFYDWCFFVTLPREIECPSANLNGAENANVVVRCLCELGVIKTYSTFFLEPEFLGGILTIPVLIFDTALFIQICKLLRGLSELHQKIRSS